MYVEETELFSIFKSPNCSSNPNIIFTFPTSNGSKYDIMNFDVLSPILNENLLIVLIQTDDYSCFYSTASDEIKIKYLSKFIRDVKNVFNYVLKKYPTNKKPILLGCSMGGFYAQYFYMSCPNKFICFSLSGFSNLSLLDKNGQSHNFNDDKVINYYANKFMWDFYNPVYLEHKHRILSKIFICFAVHDDGIFIDDSVSFYYNSNISNYIKYYDEYHSFPSWRNMAYDIFKGCGPEFHEFRLDFYRP